MILIITHKKDFTADYLINLLNGRNIPYRRFNCEDILQSNINLSFDPDFCFSLLGQQKYTSVWFRRTMLPNIEMDSKHEQAYILGEIEDFMMNLFSVIDAKWLSNPDKVYRAENKLFQLKIARQIGFNIPQTLVTNDKSAIRDFYQHHGSLIIKPISRTRIDKEHNAEFIFTNRLSKQHIDNLDDYDLSPCIFQKEIDKKVELRITVVDDQVFAAQVDSQSDNETKIDWRRKKLIFSPCVLPLEIQQKCIDLVKTMGLVFGAIDLILSPDGSYTFLEINPNGQWVWIETETGMKISDAIINALI